MRTRPPRTVLACAFVLLTAVAATSARAQQAAGLRAAFAELASTERVRPNAEAGPTEVEAALFVVDVMRIEDVDLTFTADFLVNLRWHDPRLALPQASGPSVRSIPLGEVWHPALQVVNPRDLSSQYPERITVDEHGGCSYMQRYIGTLSFALDLRDFPFDAQELPIELISLLHTSDEVRFSMPEATTGRADDLTIVDWRLGPGTFEVAPVRLRAAGQAWSGFHAVFRAERYANYFVLKVIVPLVIIVAMSWIVFLLRPEHAAPQVGLGATSVLTLVAYRFLLGNLVPRVSYFTRLDVFILGATVLVFLALVEAVLTSNLAASGRREGAVRIDQVSRVVFPVAFAGLMVYVFA